MSGGSYLTGYFEYVKIGEDEVCANHLLEIRTVIDNDADFDEAAYVPDYEAMNAVLDDVPESRDIVHFEPHLHHLAPVKIVKGHHYECATPVCGKSTYTLLARDKDRKLIREVAETKVKGKGTHAEKDIKEMMLV